MWIHKKYSCGYIIKIYVDTQLRFMWIQDKDLCRHIIKIYVDTDYNNVEIEIMRMMWIIRIEIS